MKISRKIHLEIRLQNLAFSLLFLAVVGLLGWLSTRYSAKFDWTAGARHTLPESSRKVLDLLESPVQITAYARENRQLREQIDDQVGRFLRYKKDLSLAYVNPDTQPDKVRELGITVDGELFIEYQGRSEKIQQASETALTNALQRLALAKEQRIVFLEGHGERSPNGRADHDLSQFGEELGRKGISVTGLNLAATAAIPDNTSVLVVAGPRTNLLAGEVALLQDYIKKGRSLLWLADPGDLHGMMAVAQQLGLKVLPGTVVDASTQIFGINDPTFALVAEYTPHAITSQFEKLTIFPGAAALQKATEGEGQFEYEPILSTLARSWTETGPIEGKIQYDAAKGEKQGPLQIGFAITRTFKNEASDKPEAAKSNHQGQDGASQQTSVQRIVVVGDGDFLSNAFLGDGGNLELGLNLIHWLSQNDKFINIPPRTVADRSLNFSESTLGMLAVGFLILLPMGLIGTGGFIWFQRRRR